MQVMLPPAQDWSLEFDWLQDKNDTMAASNSTTLTNSSTNAL